MEMDPLEEEEAAPWGLWRRLLLRDGRADAAAAASVMRAYHPHDGDDALRGLWRAWRGRRRRRSKEAADQEVADAHVLLLLWAAASTGGRPETALACELLRLGAEDAARDLLVFTQVAELWNQAPETPSLPVAARDRLRTQLIHTATAMLVARRAYAHDDPTTLEEEKDDATANRADAIRWDEFAALPCALDASALQKSKDGRAYLQHVDAIVAVQQWRVTHAEDEAEDVTSPSQVNELLKEAVRRLESCATAQTKIPTTRNINGTDTIYSECEDASSVCVYLCRDGAAHSDRETVEPAAPRATISTVDERVAVDLDSGDGTVETLRQELQVIHELRPLSIRVAAMLGRQLQTGVPLINCGDDASAREWERRVRKEVNSLTSGGRSDPQLLQLLRYAALVPATVIDAILGSVTTTSHAHAFFAQLFAWCPLLLRWRDPSEPTASSQVLASFAAELTRVVNVEDAAERAMEDCPMFLFMLELSARAGASLEPDVAVESVFWRVLDGIEDAVDPMPLARLFDLLHRFLTQLRECERSCSRELLAKSFAVVGERYRRVCHRDDCGSGNERKRVVDFRDIALVLSRDIVVASRPEMLEDWSSDIPTQTLLEVHGVRAAQSVDDAFLSSADSLGITPALKLSIQRCLWSLVWASEDLKDYTNLCDQLARVVKRAFVDPSGSLTVSGASVVQIEIAHMLFGSGTRGFARILKVVEAVLLPMTHEAERARGELITASTRHPQAAVQEVMDYVVRCWCLGAFGCDTRDIASALSMLEHAMRTFDRAVEAACEDPSRLLHCLQVVGLVNSWLFSVTSVTHVREFMQRIEIAAVRVLFLLAQVPSSKLSTDHEKELFRQSAAAVLVESQLLESETVTRFLQTTVRQG